MADRDGQGIGGMVGDRIRRQRQQHLHHADHLVLGRTATAADGTLDLLRRVVVAGDAPSTGSGENGTPRLADRERGADVLAEIQRLQSDRVWAVSIEQHGHALLKLGEPQLGGCARACADDAPVECDEAPGATTDDPVPEVRQPGIDAEDHHET